MGEKDSSFAPPQRPAPRLVAMAGWHRAGGCARLRSDRPSNNRDWTPDRRVLPLAFFRGHYVDISNVRNIDARSTDDYTVRHYDRTFDLDALRSLWFVVEPFHGLEGPAHTLMSFGFDNECTWRFRSRSGRRRARSSRRCSAFSSDTS